MKREDFIRALMKRPEEPVAVEVAPLPVSKSVPPLVHPPGSVTMVPSLGGPSEALGRYPVPAPSKTVSAHAHARGLLDHEPIGGPRFVSFNDQEQQRFARFVHQKPIPSTKEVRDFLAIYGAYDLDVELSVERGRVTYKFKVPIGDAHGEYAIEVNDESYWG